MRWGLASSVVASVLGLLLATAAVLGLGWLALQRPAIPTEIKDTGQFFEGLRIGLYVVAGLGAAVGLTVSYRKQQGEEESAFTDRYSRAAEQLGHEKAAVRLAGVYAVARLADDWENQRQTCIDVLCAYLRMPYQPEVAPAGEREVRLTVIRIIRKHLVPGLVDSAASWRNKPLDFTGATFDGGDFSFADFSGQDVVFKKATFCGDVDFMLAKFSGTVDFTYTVFSKGYINFLSVGFTDGLTTFYGATFEGASVEFAPLAFSGGNVSFDKATFSAGDVLFSGDIRNSGVFFTGATFSGGSFRYSGEVHGGELDFHEAEFCGSEVSFEGANFSSGKVDFRFCKFSGGVVAFDYARFTGCHVDFEDADLVGSELDFARVRTWRVAPRNLPPRGTPGLLMPGDPLLDDAAPE